MASSSNEAQVAAPAEDKSKQQRDAEMKNLGGAEKESAGMDSGAAARAMQSLSAQISEEEAQTKEKARQLASVAVNKADIEPLTQYFRISAVDADRALRQHGGCLETTILSLLE